MVRLMAPPTYVHVKVHPQRFRTRRFGIFPAWQDCYAVEIVDHGWTQSYCTAGDVERMARNWLAINYDTDPYHYALNIEYLTPVANGDQQQLCSYCNRVYNTKDAGSHFIPCEKCDSLEHATCQH